MPAGVDAFTGFTPATAAPATTSPLSAVRRLMPTLHLLRTAGPLGTGGLVELLRCHVPGAQERTPYQARHAGGHRADPALLGRNRRIRVGRSRTVDLHGVVQRH